MKLTGMSPLCLTMALGAVAAGSMKAYEQLRVAAKAAMKGGCYYFIMWPNRIYTGNNSCAVGNRLSLK